MILAWLPKIIGLISHVYFRHHFLALFMSIQKLTVISQQSLGCLKDSVLFILLETAKNYLIETTHAV